MIKTAQNVIGFLKNNVGLIGAGTAGAVAGGAVGYAAGKRKRRKTVKHPKSKRKSRKSYYKRKGRRYTPHTAGKRRDTSHKRIRYTANGQPYVILGSGKARFISKRSAKVSHKRSGGRY